MIHIPTEGEVKQLVKHWVERCTDFLENDERGEIGKQISSTDRTELSGTDGLKCPTCSEKMVLKPNKKQRKHRSKGLSINSCSIRRAERRNHVWSYDFLFDITVSGKKLKILAIIDEYTRECLDIVVARKLSHKDVLAALEKLWLTRGLPEYVRSDNGSEFRAAEVQEWLTSRGSSTLHISPG